MSDNLKWMNRHAVLLREPQWAGIAARENYKIRPDLQPLFDVHSDSMELLDAMAEKKLYREGCEFIARMIHRRAAVWWGYCCLLDLFEEREEAKSAPAAMDKILKLATELCQAAGIEMPKLPPSMDDLDNFCKSPKIDYEKLLKDYEPPPQDNTAINAASASVKKEIDRLESLIPSAVKDKVSDCREKVVKRFVELYGATPEAILEKKKEFAAKNFVNYKVNRFDSPKLKPVLSLPEQLESMRQGIVNQIKGAFPEKYPATPEAKLLLKAAAKKRSDTAVQAIWRWIVSPDERNTTLAMEAGNGAPGTPEGILAYTAAWSFGDLAPEGKMMVPVPPELPGTGLNSALLMMALDKGGKLKMPERFERYFKLGMDVVFGKNLWPENVSDELSPHAQLAAKWAGKEA